MDSFKAKIIARTEKYAEEGNSICQAVFDEYKVMFSWPEEHAGTERYFRCGKAGEGDYAIVSSISDGLHLEYVEFYDTLGVAVDIQASINCSELACDYLAEEIKEGNVDPEILCYVSECDLERLIGNPKAMSDKGQYNYAMSKLLR